MKTEFDDFLEAAAQFLNEGLVERATEARYSWDEPIEVSHYEVTAMRKNRDESASFYNGRERIKKIEVSEKKVEAE